MKTKTPDRLVSTNDSIIRAALIKELSTRHSSDVQARIIEELGVRHGHARIDVAVVNGILHGYEIKSDRDTLKRLPEQMKEYNKVFDQITLVVGKHHVYDAINMVPDWWGIVIAKTANKSSVTFTVIRDADPNKNQRGVSIARLLWKKEALEILENYGEARGYYSKSRNQIYQRLSSMLDMQTLSNEVRNMLIFRTNWRPDSMLILNGG